MDRTAILGGAEERIRQHRTAEATLCLADKAGKPLAHARAEVRLVRHEFKLGANAYRISAIEDAMLQRDYYDAFAALLNYATLPFYWGGYEPQPGQPQQPRLQQMAAWCTDNGITTKGHPLVWHEVFPKWAAALPDHQAIALLERRVREIVTQFKGQIGIWDVVNEATVSQRFDNAVGRWIKANSAAKCVADALRWASETNPEAVLLYNDFNVSADFEKLVQALLDARAPVHAIGIQSHMHKGTWPIERVWKVCETYARFRLPLHFTEATVLSGELKKDDDWHRRRDDWHTTPDGEKAQLEYGQLFYTVLFSHPAVEAITWWDFSDNGAWQGAPAGLVRRDMTPKPLYGWLLEAFHKRWATNAKATTEASGAATLRCFFGDHEVRATTQSGQVLRGRFSLPKGAARRVTVRLD